MGDSVIKNFFKDQTIFITGGTGFLGKVLIEKLLRECCVRKIFVLMRPKKDKTTQERIDAFFDFPCFDRLKTENPDFQNLVTFVDGDCGKIHLGLSSSAEEVLVEETNVVIHAAANVKFDQTLREAANINVRGTRDILEIAKKMSLLKAFVYVSTAYSNCPHSHIGEQFYDPPISAKGLINILDEIDDQILDRITPKFIVPWPNTYTFSKSIAEDLIRTEGKNLPIAIVRPGIVATTFEEPTPGWVDNFYGVMGITIGAGTGVLSSFHANIDSACNIIPCDYVANIVLSSIWNIAKEKQDNAQIYNFVISKKNWLTWRKYIRYMKQCAYDYTPEKVLWLNTFKFRKNYLWHRICVFFQHTLFAHVVDFVLVRLGREPIAVKNYDRMDKLLTLTSYFVLRNWNFDSENVDRLWDQMGESDKKLFNFDMRRIDWPSFSRRLAMGCRIYLLKDPLETVPQGQNKLRKLKMAYYFVWIIFYFLLFLFVRFILRLFFK